MSMNNKKSGFRSTLDSSLDGFTKFVPPMNNNSNNKVVEVKKETSTAGVSMKEASVGILNQTWFVNVAKMALIGMIGGGIYGLSQTVAEDKGLLIELKYPTKALDMDSFVPALLQKLQKYEYLQPKSYQLVIHYCDEFFKLERKLADKKTRPNDCDIPFAQAAFDGVMAHIMIIRNHTENGDQRAEINKIKQDLNEIMSEHRRRIYDLCAPLKL